MTNPAIQRDHTEVELAILLEMLGAEKRGSSRSSKRSEEVS